MDALRVSHQQGFGRGDPRVPQVSTSSYYESLGQPASGRDLA